MFRAFCKSVFKLSLVVSLLLVAASVSMAASYMNFNHQYRQAYTSGVGPNSIVYWTIDEHILTTTNFHTEYASTNCPIYVDACSYEPYWVTFDLSAYCDGQYHELSAIRADGNSRSGFIYNTSGGFANVGSFGGKFQCTGGGPADPDPNGKKPIIFVPGVMGSTIRGDWNGYDVPFWVNINPITTPDLPSVYNLTLDVTSDYYKPGLYASDVVRTALGQPVYAPLLNALQSMNYKPYDVSRHFSPGQGCDLSQKSSNPNDNPSLFVFPYDWRDDNNQTADKLREYVACVQQFYPPGSKIDVVAHSMGGLVVRRYILQTEMRGETNKLRKVITIASPFLGAPEAIYKIYTGGTWEISSIAVSPRNIKSLAPHFPSMHQLFPSRIYHEFYGGIMKETGDANDNGVANENYSFPQIVSKLDSDFSSTTPGTVGAGFHDLFGQDDWRDDQSGIQYSHIVAEQNQLNTTVGLSIKKTFLCRRVFTTNSLTNCHNGIYYKPEKGFGDKTVPTRSASRFSGNTYLGAPGSRLFYYRSPSANSPMEKQAEHTAVTQVPATHQLLASLLNTGQNPFARIFKSKEFSAAKTDDKDNNGNTSSINEADFVEYDGSNPPPEPDLSNYSPAYYLSIAGSIEVAVRDESGNTARVENGFLNNQLPSLSNYEVTGENSVLLTLAAENAYSVEFQAGEFPPAIEFVKGRGNLQPTLAVRYNDLDIPANSNVKMTISENDAIEVRYDADGDGEFETLVPPTASLSGAQASDTVSPIVNLSVVQNGGTATATITAHDEGSGVGKIWYSLDGQTFQVYTSPFTLQATSNPTTIYAFADDLAANRADAVSQAVVYTNQAVKPVLECVTRNPDGTYTANFGYENFNSVSVSIPSGERNKFTPTPKERGQVTTFQPGRVVNAFSVVFNGNNLKWHLTGPDGIQQNVSASRKSPVCQ